MSSEKREASPEASPLKGPAPKAIPEDTSDVAFEDGIPLSPMTGDQTVQFISGAPANGDAKVEIGDGGAAPPTFVGLGKEELMKYANDPFWVRLRWFLFILFWILWIAMLVGAVVIIVLAPRCAEKKSPAATFYQVKAADLIKNGKYEEHAANLEKLGVKTIVVSDLLQHDPDNEPEAVTNFEKIDESVESGLFESAIKELKAKGMTLLLKFVPNHSGTSHEWFNDTMSNMYIRKNFSEVSQSPWKTQDNKVNSWSPDPRDQTLGYLHQFSGSVADLNFRNEDVVSKLKKIVTHWKDFGFDGFLISKASFLVEDLNNLMAQSSTRNQPENVDVVSKIVGTTATVLVELDGPSNETIQQYREKGIIPMLKSIDASNTDTIRESLENLSDYPEAIVNLAETSQTQNARKARLVNLLASAGGSKTLLNHDAGNDEEQEKFLKELLEFKEKNPRGKEAKLEYASKGNVIAALRSDGDKHLIVANMGEAEDTFNASSLNVTDVKGVVELVTPNAPQKSGDAISGTEIRVGPLSGLVIKLEKKEEES